MPAARVVDGDADAAGRGRGDRRRAPRRRGRLYLIAFDTRFDHDLPARAGCLPARTAPRVDGRLGERHVGALGQRAHQLERRRATSRTDRDRLERDRDAAGLDPRDVEDVVDQAARCRLALLDDLGPARDGRRCSSACVSSSAKPMMAVSGVRSSWLMRERKSFLAALAARSLTVGRLQLRSAKTGLQDLGAPARRSPALPCRRTNSVTSSTRWMMYAQPAVGVEDRGVDAGSSSAPRSRRPRPRAGGCRTSGPPSCPAPVGRAPAPATRAGCSRRSRRRVVGVVGEDVEDAAADDRVALGHRRGR